MKNAAIISLAAALVAACQFIPGQPEYEIEQAKKAVSLEFPDPDSTQFRDVRRLRTTLNGQENWSVCGRVNTKNLMGAYVGYRLFVHNKGRTLVDPGIDYEAVIRRNEDCTAALTQERSEGYRNNIRSRVACRIADEGQAEVELDHLWRTIYTNNCGGYLGVTRPSQ